MPTAVTWRHADNRNVTACWHLSYQPSLTASQILPGQEFETRTLPGQEFEPRTLPGQEF